MVSLFLFPFFEMGEDPLALSCSLALLLEGSFLPALRMYLPKVGGIGDGSKICFPSRSVGLERGEEPTKGVRLLSKESLSFPYDVSYQQHGGEESNEKPFIGFGGGISRAKGISPPPISFPLSFLRSSICESPFPFSSFLFGQKLLKKKGAKEASKVRKEADYASLLPSIPLFFSFPLSPLRPPPSCKVKPENFMKCPHARGRRPPVVCALPLFCS